MPSLVPSLTQGGHEKEEGGDAQEEGIWLGVGQQFMDGGACCLLPLVPGGAPITALLHLSTGLRAGPQRLAGGGDTGQQLPQPEGGRQRHVGPGKEPPEPGVPDGFPHLRVEQQLHHHVDAHEEADDGDEGPRRAEPPGPVGRVGGHADGGPQQHTAAVQAAPPDVQQRVEDVEVPQVLQDIPAALAVGVEQRGDHHVGPAERQRAGHRLPGAHPRHQPGGH